MARLPSDTIERVEIDVMLLALREALELLDAGEFDDCRSRLLSVRADYHRRRGEAELRRLDRAEGIAAGRIVEIRAKLRI